MKKCNKPGLLLTGLAALAIVVAPAMAWAGTPGGGANSGISSVTCKSGKKVPNPKRCKENGGKF